MVNMKKNIEVIILIKMLFLSMGNCCPYPQGISECE